ncbi:hypothetical protein M5238_001714 [Vibrio vulnificus]|uniref:hypothetical protein n=1 Tax=Vibrio vulnificus TaxID=672 RepID=UPI0021DA4A8B|nr:hypothetical protein [Vibrio vulnificus]ELP5900524.1 hypothetical protein [Vibrio vulnificus]MCU8208024.1 hypothetical protein [Vibrio vulnificus]
MKSKTLTSAESHELACRVSALGAKQVLLVLRQLQEQALNRQDKSPSHRSALKH